MDADVVRGGPNAHYSLTAARANFRDHGHMYDSDQASPIFDEPSSKRQALLDYVRQVMGGSPFDPDEFQRLLEVEDQAARRRRS